MAEEKTLSSQTVFEGRVVKLRVNTVETVGGRQSTREVIEHGEVVAMVVLDDQGQVIMVEQYRGAVGKLILEIPAGGVEPGEAVVDAVRRELREEIGYLPRNIEKLVGFYAAPGYCTEFLHIYLATDLVPSQLFAEDTEEISLVRVPLDRVMTLITSGEINDGKSVAGLLFYLAVKGQGS
ncbi:MAG: NUDIX hydrolase [Dehalococcoidales bacterium]|jgi:ADP-ribose pyrophosphatase